MRTVAAAILAGVLFVSTTPADVVISELMYHPGSDLDGDEFVELHNPGSTTENLDNWCFVDGVLACFTLAHTIPPGGYLVVAADFDGFTATYGFPPDHSYTLTLDDNGERLALADHNGSLVDEVAYDDGGQWPVLPDGLGPSLQLIDAIPARMKDVINQAKQSRTRSFYGFYESFIGGLLQALLKEF